MKNKVKRLLIGSTIVIGVCLIAIKMEIIPIVNAKIADVMTDTKVIYYNQGKSPEARAAVSPDRKQLAFCLGEQEFSVQELSTGKITTYPVEENVFQVKYSPDGRYLAAGRNILNTKTGEVTTLSTQANPGFSFDEIAFSKNGDLIAMVNSEWALHPRPTVIEIWNLQTKQLIQKFTKDRFLIYQMSFSPDGHHLAVAGDAITVWDTQTGKCVKTLGSKLTPSDNIFPDPDNYPSLAYSPDGKHLAAVLESSYSKNQRNETSHTQAIEIWDVEQEKVVKTLDGGPYSLDKLQYSPDGQFIATGRTIYDSFDMIRDAVWIWDVNRGEVVNKLPRYPDSSLLTMGYSADGNYISAGGHYYTKIWKVK